MSENHGEPIPAGQGPKAWDELTARFEQGVDLGKIKQLLAQSRERTGQSQETVCTLNLVAIYFNAAQYERARDALEAAGMLHPCRLLVLIADETIAADEVTARISAVRQAGAISLERIVLTATGKSVRLLESAMMGLLLPELPMVVVWGGRPEGDLLHRAVETADRIIIDSGARSPTYLPETAALVAQGAPIGDLAWARIFPWQGLAADVFDLPNLREHRGNIEKARIVCAGAIGAEGFLLAGWLASRIPRLQVSVGRLPGRHRLRRGDDADHGHPPRRAGRARPRRAARALGAARDLQLPAREGHPHRRGEGRRRRRRGPPRAPAGGDARATARARAQAAHRPGRALCAGGAGGGKAAPEGRVVSGHAVRAGSRSAP